MDKMDHMMVKKEQKNNKKQPKGANHTNNILDTVEAT
jgi:hypothetical protein